jgi:hypothetical protein
MASRRRLRRRSRMKYNATRIAIRKTKGKETPIPMMAPFDNELPPDDDEETLLLVPELLKLERQSELLVASPATVIRGVVTPFSGP